MSFTSLPRRWGIAGPAAAAAALVLAMTGAVAAWDEASPEPDSSSGAAAMGSPAPDASLPVAHPLPDIVGPIPPDLPTVSLEPESTAGAEPGVPFPYSLGHCGILSPVDVDGSLWQPVSGSNAAGGALESDDEIGELINATSGELVIDGDAATFTTTLGSTIALVRAPGAVEYTLCM